MAKTLHRATGAQARLLGLQMGECECWLARYSKRPCDRPSVLLWRVHLLPKQRLKARGFDPWDERGYVWACGGASGLAGHHHELDERGLRERIPRSEIPPETIELAVESGLVAWLDSRHGEGILR